MWKSLSLKFVDKKNSNFVVFMGILVCSFKEEFIEGSRRGQGRGQTFTNPKCQKRRPKKSSNSLKVLKHLWISNNLVSILKSKFPATSFIF